LALDHKMNEVNLWHCRAGL